MARVGWQTLRASRGYRSYARNSTVPIAKALWVWLLPLGRQVAYVEHYEGVLDAVGIHSSPRSHKLQRQIKEAAEKTSSYYVEAKAAAGQRESESGGESTLSK